MYEIQQSFSIPEPNQFVIECKDPIMIKLLNGIVDKNIINYLNANNDSAAIELFSRTESITKLQRAMGHSSVNVSLTYLRGLEIPELKEEDMPMI